MRRTLWLALACALASPSAADEGFFTADKPPAVRAIWRSVYAFVCESRKSEYVASAFLVHKVDKEHTRRKTRRRKLADYYFVTAGHAIEECKLPRRYLAENINQRRFERDGITVARPPRRLRSVELVQVDEVYDIAIIKATASASLVMGAPVPVDDQCDRALHQEVYAVGFPGVGKRRSLHLKRDVKRWSKGEFVGLGIADFREVDAVYIAASVDSLPGSSGGPVVDKSGRLVGVVAKGASGADNKFRYDVDPKKPNDWQTFLAPCDAVLQLLRKSGLE